MSSNNNKGSKNTIGSDLTSDRDAVEKYWVKAVQKGDKQAYRMMFEAWYDPLLRFAFRYVESRAIAEGLVQEVFLWIWQNRADWEVRGKLKTYLFRAVKYEAIDHLRKDRTRDKYVEKFSEIRETKVEPKLPETDDESEFIRATQQAIEELPERARMVYKLSRLEGLTYKEIAQVLEISPKTVETHMSRALDYLRDRLKKFLPVLVTLLYCLPGANFLF
ncbi:RNA polymerase sigma-70 factor [Halalkalibaculum sp. DA3122]|uniref:RNA polymerase sigma-70 factor n=1 Tax=Halalkalibaculum sp. DA3122 TaxID=3373607 RepID=UPI0037548A3B